MIEQGLNTAIVRSFEVILDPSSLKTSIEFNAVFSFVVHLFYVALSLPTTSIWASIRVSHIQHRVLIISPFPPIYP
jgi:hypothetical protein